MVPDSTDQLHTRPVFVWSASDVKLAPLTKSSWSGINYSMTVHVRAPKVSAEINGIIVNSVIHVDITNSGSCKSSRFDLTVSTSGNARDNQWLKSISSYVTVGITIQFSDIRSGVVSFDGLADSISVDPINSTAHLVGRDYSSILISSTSQESFYNQTASEIVNEIASRHGFSSNVATTSRMVGSYQNNNYGHLSLSDHSQTITEWDLLRHLANSEEFEMFVDGTTLVFTPLGSLSRGNMTLDITSVIGMKFWKNCPLSDQPGLTVKSWNSWIGQVFSYTHESSKTRRDLNASYPIEGPGSGIAIIRPNLFPSDAERLAKQQHALLRQRDLTVQIVMPGETSLKPGDVLAITSPAGSFGSNFIVMSMRREFSTARGFLQHVHAFANDINPLL